MRDFLIDLTRGGRVLQASDEYLNPAERLLDPNRPIADPGRSGAHGRWLDGWETRRVRPPGHEWAIIRLGRRGTLRHVIVDTSHITTSLPGACSIEAIDLPGNPSLVELMRNRSLWSEIVPRTEMRGGGEHCFDVAPGAATHLRLVIYPDGAVARLRALGDPLPLADLADRGTIDLASSELGAQVIDASDPTTSSPNLMLGPGDSKDHRDGWMTRRRRTPGNEWAVVRLAGRGTIERIEVDTKHFPGNAPEAVAVQGVDAPGATRSDLRIADWTSLLPHTELASVGKLRFDGLEQSGTFTHLRVELHPDGAIGRFRAFGTVDNRAADDPAD